MTIKPTSLIHGVAFFDNPRSCIDYYEQTHTIKKVIDFIRSCGNFLIGVFNKINRSMHQAEKQWESLINAQNKDFTKKRLIVCIHGLGDDPLQFKKIADEMQKKTLSETDIFIPRVNEKGHAKLDLTVKPIFEKIVKWANTPGEKELVLIGISNGARIARALEIELSKSNTRHPSHLKKLHSVSIVGAGNGSSLVNLANALRLSPLMSQPIAEEMPIDSLRNQCLNKEWNEMSTRWIREYTFIASPHDWLVPNYDSTLMKVVNQKARYAFVPNHGHCSITEGDDVAKAVAELTGVNQSGG